MGRRGTIWDLGTGPGGRISLRISPGGSRPLNLNFFFTILEPKNAQMSIFGKFLKMDTPSQGGFGPQGPKGAQGAQAPLYLGPRGPKGAQGGPRGPKGPKGAQAAPLYLE